MAYDKSCNWIDVVIPILEWEVASTAVVCYCSKLYTPAVFMVARNSAPGRAIYPSPSTRPLPFSMDHDILTDNPRIGMRFLIVGHPSVLTLVFHSVCALGISFFLI